MDLAWTHLDSLALTRLDSLDLTWSHLGSFNFTWIHLMSLLSCWCFVECPLKPQAHTREYIAPPIKPQCYSSLYNTYPWNPSTAHWRKRERRRPRPMDWQTRFHLPARRTKRNDFTVGLSPPTSDIYIYIVIVIVITRIFRLHEYCRTVKVFVRLHECWVVITYCCVRPYDIHLLPSFTK